MQPSGSPVLSSAVLEQHAASAAVAHRPPPPPPLHRRSPSLINHTPRAFDVRDKSIPLPRSHRQRPASSFEVWTLSSRCGRMSAKSDDDGGRSDGSAGEASLSCCEGRESNSFETAKEEETALLTESEEMSSYGPGPGPGPGPLDGDDAPPPSKPSLFPPLKLRTDFSDDDPSSDKPNRRTEIRSPVLPRSNASMEMAYFLRHTGPPISESSCRIPETAGVRKRRFRENPRHAFKMLSYSKRGTSAGFPEFQDQIPYRPPEGVVQRISKDGKKYLQITIDSLDDDDERFSTHHHHRRRASAAPTARTETVETNDLDTWLSRFSFQQRGSSPTLDVFPSSMPLPMRDSLPLPTPTPTQRDSGHGETEAEKAAEKAWATFGPRGESPPPPSPSSSLPMRCEQDPLHDPLQDPLLDSPSSSVSSVSEPTTPRLGASPRLDLSSSPGSSVIDRPRPLRGYSGTSSLGRSSEITRRKREEKIRARKLRDLRRARSSCVPGIDANIDEVVQRPLSSKPSDVTLQKSRPSPNTLSAAEEESTNADAGACEPRIKSDESPTYTTGYTPISGQISLSPVMLVAEQVPLLLPPHPKANKRPTKRPPRLQLAEQSSNKIALAERPRPDDSPIEHSRSSLDTVDEASARRPHSTSSKMVKPTRSHSHSQRTYSAPPTTLSHPVPPIPATSTKDPKRHAPQSSAGSTGTVQMQPRTSICSSHTSVSSKTRLEARVEALERENRLLEAALMAVLKTSGTLNGCPCTLRHETEKGRRTEESEALNVFLETRGGL